MIDKKIKSTTLSLLLATILATGCTAATDSTNATAVKNETEKTNVSEDGKEYILYIFEDYLTNVNTALENLNNTTMNLYYEENGDVIETITKEKIDTYVEAKNTYINTLKNIEEPATKEFEKNEQELKKLHKEEIALYNEQEKIIKKFQGKSVTQLEDEKLSDELGENELAIEEVGEKINVIIDEMRVKYNNSL